MDYVLVFFYGKKNLKDGKHGPDSKHCNGLEIHFFWLLIQVELLLLRSCNCTSAQRPHPNIVAAVTVMVKYKTKSGV